MPNRTTSTRSLRRQISRGFWGALLPGSLLVAFAWWTHWYALLAGLLLIPAFLWLTRKPFSGWPRWQRILTWLLAFPLYFVVMFLLGGLLKVFLFEIRVVPSESMQQAIIPGDELWVTKWQYGPQLPGTYGDLPWYDLLSVIDSATWARGHDAPLWGYRLPGHSDVQRGDVVVFKQHRSQQVFVKRCMGLPGDTLQLRNNQILINQQVLPPLPTTVHLYQLDSLPGDTRAFFIRHQLPFVWNTRQHYGWLSLTARQYQWVTDSLAQDTLPLLSRQKPNRHFPVDAQRSLRSVFPHSDRFNWSQFQFGPLWIPQKGDTLTLTDRHFLLYKEAIEYETRQKLYKQNQQYMLDSTAITHYVFRQHYYFMLGDNRHLSSDSRYWGLVPRPQLIGKAHKVIFNLYRWKNTHRWWKSL